MNLSKIIALVKASSKNSLYLVVLFILAESAVFFTSLYLLKKLVDIVAHVQQHSEQSYRQILIYVIAAGVAGVVYLMIRSYSAYLVEAQAARVAEYVNEQIHTRAVNLDLSFYESPSYYDTLKRAMDSGAERPSLIITTLIELLKNAASLAAVGAVLILINWMLLPLLALFILPTLFVRLHYSKKLNDWRIAQTPLERKSAYYSTLITTDTAAKEIRAYDLGNYLKNQFVAIRKTLMKEKLAINLKRTRLESFTTAMSNIGVFVCIGFIALKTVSGETSAGDITLFLVAFPQSFTILQNIAAGISLLFQNSIYVNSIFELLELKDRLSEPREQPAPLPQQGKELVLENVSFTYPHAAVPTLKNINLSIPSGRIIAIAGLNGAGKSTLIKLLCRLYDPGSGKVLLNGTDIRNYDAHEFRKMIGVVFQDFNRYSFTAAENIYLGNIQAPFDERRAKEAAEKSGAATFINSFPKQYDTVMGRLFEDGQEVSIGQWQKLALARCFYSDAQFLILDEATSALDAASESGLFDTLREKLDNRTAIVISHRHSSLKHADYIYFLDGGTIVEQGTDQELMALQGAYAKLFTEKDLSTPQ
ncbi:ABC transporter [Niabella ginsenosidivorans]|uniref:ABC transporter n=2 Tax=Niabella ginsenosidivorans TaxID=1176587 RepID=A0A1A9I5Q8_9BACT|nr:ABC transporter [Niabella ginsenosidivorans]